MRKTMSVCLLLVATTLGAQVRPVRPPRPVAPVAPAPPAPPLESVDRFAIEEAMQEARAEAMSARTLAMSTISQTDIQSAMADARSAATAVATTFAMSAPFGSRASFAQMPRSPWAQQDPADSLYRLAREQLNRGDYRRAATLFKEIPQKFPNSAYAADSPYWQAFALYRIGGTAELQEALAALEAQKAKYPSARTLTPSESNRGEGQGYGLSASRRNYNVSSQSQADASALAARIAGVLSTRGMSDDAAVKRALSAGGGATCDREDQSVRAEALNALMETDPDAAQQLTKKILARRDDCSVPLRRNAVFIVGNKRDASAAATLIGVAKGDASPDVRSEAVNWLTRIPGDEALNALIELSQKTDDDRVQRTAVRSLAGMANPRARTAIRALVEKNDAPEPLRLSALDGLDRDRMTADDAAWLRGLYAKTDSPRIKGRIAAAVGRLGGDANNQWLLALAKNDDESIDARIQALNRAGETLDVPSLSKLYDGLSERPLRESLINLLGMRKEPEAVDKLLDIVKSGTDPQLRRFAINVLSRKKDPRTTKLLMELIEK